MTDRELHACQIITNGHIIMSRALVRIGLGGLSAEECAQIAAQALKDAGELANARKDDDASSD